MLYFAISLFFGLSSSAPADSCGDQFGCLQIDTTEISVGEFEICLYWNSSLTSCDKSGSISHACPSDEESDKIEGWEEGRETAMCNTVACDDYAVFGIKDGRGCSGSSGAYSFSDVDGIYCGASSDGGFCGGGAKKDCMWVVPAPECEDTTTSTTTATPGTTGTTQTPDSTTTTTATTTAEPTTTATVDCTVEDPGCGEFDFDGCTNGPFANCVWTAQSTCTVDPCDLPEASCSAQCGCQWINAAVGCIALPDELASNAIVREDAYDNKELTSDDEHNLFAKYNWWILAGAAVVLGGAACGIAACLYCYCSKKRNKAVRIGDDDNDEHEIVQGTGGNTEMYDMSPLDTAR